MSEITCVEATKSCFKDRSTVLKTSEIIAAVQKKGNWKESTIWRGLMSNVVDLPPVRKGWPSNKLFLLVKDDCRYELHDNLRHPATLE